MSKNLPIIAAMLLSTTAAAGIRLRPELIQTGEKWSFPGGAGTELHGKRWLPATQPKAVLICVHGTQTHSGWFGALAVELNHHGWAVYAPDRKGSGLNLKTDKLGLPVPEPVAAWSQWVQDLDGAVEQVLREQRADGRKPPVYLLGSSWGTALTAAYMDSQPRWRGKWQPEHADQVSGLVLSVPSGLKSKVPGLLKKAEVVLLGGPLALLGKAMPPFRRASTGIGLPSRTYSGQDATRTLIGDRDIPLLQPEPPLQLGAQDPRMVHRATYGFMLQSASMRRAAVKAMKSLREVPVLSVLTEKDDIADNENLKKLLPPESIVTVEDSEHAIQVERADLLAVELLKWHQRISSKQVASSTP